MRMNEDEILETDGVRDIIYPRDIYLLVHVWGDIYRCHPPNVSNIKNK